MYQDNGTNNPVPATRDEQKKIVSILLKVIFVKEMEFYRFHSNGFPLQPFVHKNSRLILVAIYLVLIFWGWRDGRSDDTHDQRVASRVIIYVSVITAHLSTCVLCRH